LANSSGQVGRNLVENVTAFARGSFPDAAGRQVSNEDGWGTGMMIAPFINVDENTRSKKFLRRFALNIRGGFGMGPGSARGGPRFGAAMKREIRRNYGSGISVSGSAEGLWSPHNYVDIDPDVKDAWGIPAARIHLTFGENDQAVVDEMTAWGRNLIEAAGGVVSAWQLSTSIPGGQIHEQGTCRMGDDPKRFVTDRWGTCHDVPNLVIGDGALHVTCATQNPTLTILALAMRNAAHLAGEFGAG
jgi:choline dehydrogenase-like flavoprotein